MAALVLLAPTAFGQVPTTDAVAGASLTLPMVVDHVDAVYPPDKLAQGIGAKVELLVTVERDGTVGDATVAVSGGAEFDVAAVDAVKRWRFIPATRSGTPIRARIRIPFHFSPDGRQPTGGHEHAVLESVLKQIQQKLKPRAKPKASAKPPKRPKPAAPPKPVEPAEPPVDLETGLALPHSVSRPGKPIESLVQGHIRPAVRSASDFRLDRDIIKAVPRGTAADLVRSAPGVHVMRPEGEAIAPRMTLRGFDAHYGQDIQFTVLGTIPLNQPSHIHGHGYASLNMLIPETVRSVRVLEGVYDPNQGDFAIAGSVDFDFGVAHRGIQSTYGYGSFDTLQTLGVFAPAGHAEETFGAATVRTTAGFGNGVRASTSGAFIGQYRLDLPAQTTALLHVSGHGVRAGIAGVLRRDDIHSGRVDFLGAYDDTSARSQSASVARVQAGLSIQKAWDDGTATSIGFWGAYATYRSHTNFTGYTERSRIRPEWAGRGDLVEASNDDVGAGARLTVRTRRFRLLSWLDLQFTRGADIEVHAIDQGQNLVETPQNQTWDRRVDASIKTLRAGVFLDGVMSVTTRARLRGGLRTDFVLYHVEDRLGNLVPLQRESTHEVGFQRTAAGVAWGPRVALEVDPRPYVRLFAAYGHGYRTPQARQLGDGEDAPFAKVHSYEIGAKIRSDSRRLLATLIAYESRLSHDWAFDPISGRFERIGPTVRRGFVVQGQAEPLVGLKASFSTTFVDATLDAPAAPTPHDPAPAYIEGQAVPYVPAVLMRLDLIYQRTLTQLWGKPLIGRVGYGATFVSSRPLPHAQYAQPVFTVDAAASIRRYPLELGIDVLNLFDRRYADTEYVFVSDWATNELPSQLPARHISAGAPLTVLGTATFRF